jgi:chromate transport protein ChrA
MFGLAMAVRKFPSDLPDVVPPLFSGLNSAAVGLIALAGYSLSKSSGKTALTKLIVFLTGAIPTLYTSLWLFPTIIAGSGLLTWTSDEVLRKFPRAGRRARNWDGSPPSSGDGAVPQVLPEQIQPEEIRSTPREIEAASAKSQPGSTVLRRSMSRLSPALEQTHTQPAAIVAIQPLHFGLSVMAGLTM